MLIIKLYLRYLFHNKSEYILNYINKILNINCTDVNIAINQIIPNYKILLEMMQKYNLELGKFVYDHKHELYEYIDFTMETSVMVISEEFNINYLYNALLTNKTELIIYNPLKGIFLRINDLNLDFFN